MSKYIQISIFTGKRFSWRLFKFSCWYEGLQLHEKVISTQMLFCETCEILQNKIFKENCWSTASDFYILDVSLVLFAINQLSRTLEMAVHKRLTLFALEIFEDNQNMSKIESNIFQMRSTQQRK